MKLVKTLLLTTAAVVAFNASAKTHFEGTFVGAQLGTSKAGAAKADTFTASGKTHSFKDQTGYKHSRKFGVNGGVLVGHRAAVAQDVILGVTLGVDLESTKYKQAINKDELTADVKRKYVVNLLGQAGYTVTKDVLAFVTAGVSYAQFKFSGKTDIGSISKNKGKFGYVVGAGAAYAINETVSANLQYLYTGYGKAKASVTDAAKDSVTLNAPKAYHAITAGVNVNI